MGLLSNKTNCKVFSFHKHYHGSKLQQNRMFTAEPVASALEGFVAVSLQTRKIFSGACLWRDFTAQCWGVRDALGLRYTRRQRYITEIEVKWSFPCWNNVFWQVCFGLSELAAYRNNILNNGAYLVEYFYFVCDRWSKPPWQSATGSTVSLVRRSLFWWGLQSYGLSPVETVGRLQGTAADRALKYVIIFRLCKYSIKTILMGRCLHLGLVQVSQVGGFCCCCCFVWALCKGQKSFLLVKRLMRWKQR